MVHTKKLSMMESKAPRLNRFAERFQMEVRLGNRVRRRIKGLRPLPVICPIDSPIDYDMRSMVEDIPCYEIVIPEDKLVDLVDTVDDLERTIHSDQHARDVLKMLRADERVRQDNPAVQKAYMKYLMLLELARK